MSDRVPDAPRSWANSAPTNGHSLPKLVGAATRTMYQYPYRTWGYGESIAFEAMLAAADATGEAEPRTFVYGYLRGWAARRAPFVETDNTAPGTALCLSIEATGDSLLLDAARDLACFLRSRPRGPERVFHSRTRVPLRRPAGGGGLSPDDEALLDVPSPGIFLDCLHFDPPFFVHLGLITGDQSLVSCGTEQARGYVRLLRDRRTGLYRHFWLGSTGQTYGRAWGRGQGWALLGLLRVARLLPEGHPDRAGIVSAFVDLCRVMLRFQQPDGGWPTVVDDDASGEESSTAAFMAVAYLEGIGAGFLDDGEFEGPARGAWQATRDRLRGDGVLTGVSEAVGACTAKSHYRHVPLGAVVPWGQGPAVLAMAAGLSEGWGR